MTFNPTEFFKDALEELGDQAGKALFDDSPMPEGVYPLVIESCVERKYIDGVARKPEALAAACAEDSTIDPGTEIALVYVVTEGKYAKRKLFGSYVVKASSNQQTYVDFTPEKKVRAGKTDLCGLMLRLGRPDVLSDWVGKMFNGYVTSKKQKDGKTRNDVRCTIKEGEENAPRPSAPQSTTAHASGSAPF